MKKHFEDIHKDILEKQINLEKLLLLPKDKSDVILKLFDDLMNSFFKGGYQLPGNIEMDIPRMVIIYNTLIDDGWLVTKRENTLNKIVDQ